MGAPRLARDESEREAAPVIGGFSDEVFKVEDAIAAGELSSSCWIEKIEEVLI